MQMTGKNRHWFGDHPKPFNQASNYNNFITSFKTIWPEIYGLEIINCTRTTALTWFPCMDLDEYAKLTRIRYDNCDHAAKG
jgi:hypothetical protein